MPRLPILLALSLAAVIPAGCHQGQPTFTDPYAAKRAHAAPLNHVVLVSLQDPKDTDACLADCRTMLARIEAVETLWVGTHVDTGRLAVDGGYDVGLCVGLKDETALQAYLEAPDHLALIEKWRPKAAGFRIFDIGGTVVDR